MPDLASIANEIRHTQFCFPAATSHEIDGAIERGIPIRLTELYRFANGMFLGEGDEFTSPDGRNFRLRIPRLDELQTVQSFGYVDDDAPLYKQTANWWQLVDYGDANWLAYDGNNDADGRILDVFHEEAGYDECHAIIAESTPDLLERLMQFKGVACNWIRLAGCGITLRCTRSRNRDTFRN